MPLNYTNIKLTFLISWKFFFHWLNAFLAGAMIKQLIITFLNLISDLEENIFNWVFIDFELLFISFFNISCIPISSLFLFLIISLLWQYKFCLNLLKLLYFILMFIFALTEFKSNFILVFWLVMFFLHLLK